MSIRAAGHDGVFDRRHNPLWSVGPTGDAAAALVNFWRKADPETGRPVHDFSDPEWNTRFLGDLYQDLSEAARKRYALLQTPVFVEEFILDRTLTPAIETFGFRVVRMIDPTCGSGHFLLGGFARLHKLWVEAEPAETPAKLAQNALDQVFGVDLNPNVVAIARFRLLIAALRATGTRRLRAWSIGGGGAADLKQYLNEYAEAEIGGRISDIGTRTVTRLDEIFELPPTTASRWRISSSRIRKSVTGGDVRD